MLPFDPAQFVVDYPQFNTLSANTLTNLYYTEALIVGRKLLSLFKDVIPDDLWDASTNTPALSNSTGQSGQSYLCSVGGSVNFGAGNITFVPYNIVVFQQLPFGWWINIGYPAYYQYSCLVLAHILTIMNIGIVGRLNAATQDPITAHFDYKDTINSTWWNQTPYGAQCWQILKQRGGFTYFGQPMFNGYPVGGYW